MKRFFTILALSLLSSAAYSQDETSILFIGNSFTGVNNLSDIVQQFCIFDGKPVYTFAHAPGGISVGDVFMGTDAHMNNPLVYDLIKSRDWDFVVLQDNQGRFALDSAVFPDPALSKVIEGHLKIRDSVHFYHPCAKMIWFSGWGLKEDALTEWIDPIQINYRVLNDSAKDVIAPIGTAWKTVINTRPAFELWSPDGMHPDMAGSYLTAAVIYGTISGNDVTINPFVHTLPVPDANYLKDIARMTLMDPLIRQQSNLDGIHSAVISWDGVQLRSAAGKAVYRWYLDNKLQATTTDSFWTPAKPGSYRVWTRDAIGTWQKSCSQEVVTTTAITEADADIDCVVYPNPVTQYVHISCGQDIVASFGIYTIAGQQQLWQARSGAATRIDLGMLPSGIYFIRSLDKDRHPVGAARKVIKL